MSRITTGWLARHTPQCPGGRQAALIDIAQDLLLTRHDLLRSVLGQRSRPWQGCPDEGVRTAGPAASRAGSPTRRKPPGVETLV
jgi:hypothetical protein